MANTRSDPAVSFIGTNTLAGEKRFRVARALGLQVAQLEDALTRELWRLRNEGGEGGRPMTLREVADHLGEKGEHTTISWLSEFYTATRSRHPAA
jgi:hypothetical protein